jgi:hypothetical protein
MFSDTGFMDSMLPAHRLNPFQVKITATANSGGGGVSGTWILLYPNPYKIGHFGQVLRPLYSQGSSTSQYLLWCECIQR